MDVPKGLGNGRWYALGPKPGEQENAVIDGNFDTPNGAPSVFYNLSKLLPGDTIEVKDTNNKTYTFRVALVTQFPNVGFPINEVFGLTKGAHLNLITCSGEWDVSNHNYTKRTVAFSTLVK